MMIEKFATLMVKRATDFVGLVEVKDNAVWDDPRTPRWDKEKSQWLVHWMSKVKGWVPGAPYCVAFDGAIAAACLEEVGLPSKYFLAAWSAHVMTNVNMLKEGELLEENPRVGAIWLARLQGTHSGHAGIVTSSSSKFVTTVEGNTFPQPTEASKDRNGNGIWIRTFQQRGRGRLVTQGFCTPKAILTIAGHRGN